MLPSASEVAASDAGPLMALGTLDRLVQAKRRGWLPHVVPCIERLHAAGRYPSAAAIDAALAAAGELGA